LQWACSAIVRRSARFTHGSACARTPRARALDRVIVHVIELAVMKRLAPLFCVLALAASQPACYGSYSASKALHRWNGKVTGDKIANSAIHLGLWLIPVYPLVFVGDFLIFNNVEFIGGSPVFN
jgi:hypothetical protein